MAGREPTEYDDHPQTDQEFGAGKMSNERVNLRTAHSVMGVDGIEQQRQKWENCGKCVFFAEPDACKIVEGPVEDDQTCDWIQPDPTAYGADEKTYLNEVNDPQAFVWALMKNNQQRYRLLDVESTPAGWLVLAEDEAKPPHRFSLSFRTFNEILSWVHHWTQEEANSLIRQGKEMNFKPPVNFEEASELFASGQMDLEDFEPFKRAKEAEEMAPKP